MYWWLLQHLAVTTLLMALVWVVCRFGRFSPAAKHALWLLVLLKLLVPPVVSWPWGLPDWHSANLASPPAVSTPAPTPAPPESPLPRTVLLSETAATEAPEVAPTPVAPVANPPKHSAPALPKAAVPTPMPKVAQQTAFEPKTLLPWLNGLWIAGAGLMLLLQCVRVARFLKVFATCPPASEEIHRQMRAVAERLGVRPPQVFVLPGTGTPLFWSLGKARLLIPEALVESLDAPAMRSVFAHELAHLKRRDHWVRWVELAASCLWWWNPLFWFVRRRIHQYAELACDAWVVWALPDDRRFYAETLVSVSELVSRGSAPAAALGMGSGIRLNFERRLAMILRERVPHRVSLKTIAVLAIVAGLAIPGWSQDAQPSEAPKAPKAPAAAKAVKAEVATKAPAAEPTKETKDPDIENALDSPVSIEFEDEHISSIVDFISDYVGVNIVLDYREVKPENPWTERTPVPLALYKEIINPPTQPSSVTPEEQGLRQRPNVRSQLSLSDAKPKEALEALLKPQGLSWCVRNGYLWISTGRFIKQECTDGKCSTDLDLIWTDGVSLDSKSEHIVQVLGPLTKSLKEGKERKPPVIFGPVIVDARAVEPPPIESFPDIYGVPPHAVPPEALHHPLLKAPPVYTTDGVVSYISLKDIPLRNALKALLIPLRLDFSVERGFVWVSTPERIAAESFADAEIPESQNKLRKVLETPVSIEFYGEHLSSICSFVADYVGLNIVLDSRVIIPQTRSPYAVAASDPQLTPINEYVTDGIVPPISVKDHRLADTLKALTRPLNLYYSVGPGFIWISSPEKIAESPFSSKPVAKGPPPPPPPTQTPSISFLMLKEWPDGSWRAQIQTERSKKWYKEGEQFEHYTLKTIDADAGTITVISEQHPKTLILDKHPEERSTRPAVTVTGNYEQDGRTIWFLEVEVPEAGEVRNIKVKPADEFLGLRFVRVLPDKHSIELEHIATKETFTVKAP